MAQLAFWLLPGAGDDGGAAAGGVLGEMFETKEVLVV